MESVKARLLRLLNCLLANYDRQDQDDGGDQDNENIGIRDEEDKYGECDSTELLPDQLIR